MLTGGSARRQIMLLLMAAAALAGLFLLLEFVVAVTSSGPTDPLAVTSSAEGTLGIPIGVGLIEVLILTVSIVLAAAMLVAALGWPLRRASFRPSRSLALGVLASASLVAAGAYLAFSGMLGGSIAYDEHMVRRADLEPGALIVLAAFFLSVTIAGLLNWRLLAASLLVWLAAAGAFGFLDSKAIDGLLLFPRTNLASIPGDFGVEVRGIHSGDATVTGEPTDADEPLMSKATALQVVPPDDDPVFRVTGAAHTRYLRTATGDTYLDGTWSQLNRTAVPLEQDASVAEALGDLAAQLHLPEAAPLHEFTDHIVVTPIEEDDTLPASVLPASSHLRSIDTPATYFPFSETLASNRELARYGMESTVPLFALRQKVTAAAVADPSYLELPDDLPPRVRELAAQVAGGEPSAYLRALRLQVYLQEAYTYGQAYTERSAQPPTGQDPVDWFLFDRRVGTSGNFSSAFVVLARSVGLPARVVSGWVVATQEETQTVRRSQAHQWAEIALAGLGWVAVDPFPRDAFVAADVDHPWEASLDELATSTRPGVRGAASAARGAPNSSDVLVELLETIDNVRDPDTRHAAQRALNALVLDRFMAMLRDHPDADFRAAAAYGLEVLANPGALGALLEALATDEDTTVRTAAAGALAVVGKDGAEEGLLQALDTDEDTTVRAASATALGALQSGWTASEMLPALRSDPSPEVRAAVALALGGIGDSAALLPLLDARGGDASTAVRAAAAEALAGWPFASLLGILEGTGEPTLRAAAARLIGEGQFGEGITPLGTALSDADEQVRDASRDALDAMGEVIWLESGGGVLSFQGDLAFLPFVTAESHEIGSPTPVFRVRGSVYTRLLRVAVGDIYRSGSWFPAEQEGLPAGVAGIGFRPQDIRPVQDPDDGNWNTIYLSGIGSVQVILSGPVPSSLHAEAFTIPVSYRMPSHTVFARGPARYGWDAIVYDYTPEQLNAAPAWDVGDRSEYMQLPDAPWVERARALATAITAGHQTPYARARAIEQHLIEEYTYQPSGPAALSAPPGVDPIEAFLFESREGTCGAFSSAFVILARSIGIPARVVSGWAVADTALSQIVFSDQSHQWAEVPFQGLGWVGFDPSPDGAPSRVPEDEIDAYERMGARVTPLESGAALVELEDETIVAPGTTTSRAEPSPRIPIFEVAGAAHTGYLRTAVGDRYEHGAWMQDDPEVVPYTAGNAVPGDTPSQEPVRSTSDRIEVLPEEGSEELPRGALPTSAGLQRADIDGVFRPSSATFSSEVTATEYSWTSEVPVFSRAQYEAAPSASTAPIHTELPDDLPDAIRELARQITSGHDSPYAKAEALERYLRENYAYVPAESNDDVVPPPGRDPVDWFLFDTREGTSGQFSSAFAVLARSVGIPARVVSGFVISPTADQQAVYTDQAHQWAEVALEGFGWVRFDPTASGGAPSRVPGAPPTPRVVEGDGGEVEVRPVDTVTDITESPDETRRRTPFAVKGTVRTVDGRDVSGMTVEIYINETKEHGGTKIGVTSSRSGLFDAVAQLPPGMDLGDYQLLARAVPNSLFNESWSDPDVQVFSGNKIELIGPAQVDLHAVAAFDGTVTDDSERGVAGREIGVTFDGLTTSSVMTDRQGRFSFSETFSVLGEHWVEVKLEGEELLLDNTARLRFDVVLPTELALYAPDSVARGEGLVVTGEVREAGGAPLDEGLVELTIAAAEEVNIVTLQVGEDGSFEHSIASFEHTGDYTLTGRYSGEEFVRPAVTEIAVRVLRGTVLTLEGPAAVRDGEQFRIAGTLLEADGRPVPNAVVRVPGVEPLSLLTDADGRFAGQVPAMFDEDAADDPHESELRVEAIFDDTDELHASQAALNIAVGVPWILVEPLEPVTRGGEAILHGAVLLGTTRPLPGVELTAGPDFAFSSNEAGAFTYAYQVPADESLGAMDLVVSAPDLDIETTVRLVVQSATTLIVTPLGKVSPGDPTVLQVALLDDTGAGIAGAVVRSGQGVDATTDESGIATLELVVPESDDLPGSRVELAYDGGDLHAPASISYFWQGAITPSGVNWLLWLGLPALVALLVAAGYAARRFELIPLLGRLRRKPPPAEPVPEPAPIEEVEDTGEPDDVEDELPDAVVGVVEEPPSVRLQIAFRKAAGDLPDVWGPDEEILVTVRVTDEGRPRAGAVVGVSVGDGAPFELTAGEDGAGAFDWSGTEPGEYAVSAEFTDDDDLVISESRSLRVVDFREEIVRLYGVFMEWAKEQGVGVTDQSTPREAETLLVGSGLPIPRQSLAQLVSRFEEADYSEHEIARRHYEAMYRAWSAVLRVDR